MGEAPLDAILNCVGAAERIIIFGHVGPDGDTLGSALGLMWLLRARGKVAHVSFEDPLPVTFRFLPGAKEVEDRPVASHDLIIAVDGSDADRYGNHFAAAYQATSRPHIVVIDHHKTNTYFGDLTWVDSRYTATAQMIYELARHARWEIDTDTATCLATGCVTDTNAFSTDHTTPDVLEVVANLMREGAPLAHIIRHTMHLRTRADAMLWGRILSTLQVENGIAWAISRAADREAVGAQEGEGSGIATFLRNIIGVHIGILFVEIDSHTVRISMRSKPSYDVSRLAFNLGGGGHAQAAGATLNMSLDEAVERVVQQAKEIVQ
ncbi:MAG: bifunctional oligoribonuclease/PAP phosphatase NrnA [Chloroflexota bacterium]|nr:bifunctional oligoribonuclease/PAP phosphatase NrnA [Chloroflexota bacterium]